MRKTWTTAFAGACLALAALAPAPTAKACGGFFCNSTPIDQNAERILFKVRDDGRTDMIVQISYQGKQEDFAWLLPLAEPPAASDLAIFPQLALTALDSQTGPQVQPCFLPALASAGSSSAPRGASADDAVQVYVDTTVGNYQAVVIGSTDAKATADWLTEHNFRISDAMLGYIKLYTAEGMKFLALKLLPEKTANDITPFKLTLPGTSPSIPLRLSAVAAEPEMGIVVWIVGNQRYEPANASDLKIADADLRFRNYSSSNWTTLVARAADGVAGRGFVTEDAEPTAGLVSRIAVPSFSQSTVQDEARAALKQVFEGASYITRLYTRISPEEMTYDPVFRKSEKGDVNRFHSAATTNTNSCGATTSTSPCDFTACGALGICRVVDLSGVPTAGCACAGGSTARTLFEPGGLGSTGLTTSISCVDQRLSYLNPGDRNAAGEVLPDPCVGIDCGGHGQCVAMNMTATCACEDGYVAIPAVATDGARSATCVMPKETVPSAFYNRRPPARDPSLPIGRALTLKAPSGPADSANPLTQTGPTTPAVSADGGTPSEAPAPVETVQRSAGDGGCSVLPSKGAHVGGLSLLTLLLSSLALGASRIRARVRRTG
jgi:hypothetical protein